MIKSLPEKDRGEKPIDPSSKKKRIRERKRERERVKEKYFILICFWMWSEVTTRLSLSLWHRFPFPLLLLALFFVSCSFLYCISLSVQFFLFCCCYNWSGSMALDSTIVPLIPSALHSILREKECSEGSQVSLCDSRDEEWKWVTRKRRDGLFDCSLDSSLGSSLDSFFFAWFGNIFSRYTSSFFLVFCVWVGGKLPSPATTVCFIPSFSVRSLPFVLPWR